MPCNSVATSENQKIRNEPIYPLSLRNLRFIVSNIQPFHAQTDEPKSARNHWSFGANKKMRNEPKPLEPNIVCNLYFQ